MVVHPTLKEILRSDGSEWNPSFLKGRLLELEDELQLREFWCRVAFLWLFGLTPGLIIVSVVVYLDIWSVRYPYVAYLIALASAIASPIVAYKQYLRVRTTRFSIRRVTFFYRQKLTEQHEREDGSRGPLVHQKRYREEIPDVIQQLRDEAKRNRRIHNRFQSVIIVGSVAASATATASVSISQARWLTVGVTAAVGLSAGFTGYFKYHERSYSSRLAADSIEREYEAVELRIGRYAKKSEEDAYTLFAEVVERIRDEHDKRQQQLDQQMEVKRQE